MDGTHILNPQVSFEATAPFYLTGIELPQPNQIFKKDISSIVGDDLGGQGLGQGSIFADGTHFKILQAGFANVEEKGFDADIGEVIDVNVVRREPDNFLLVEVRPAKVEKRIRDSLKEDFRITGGSVNDPDGFIQKVDPGFTLTLNQDPNQDPQQRSEQINSLAAVILNPNVKPGTLLTDDDLKVLGFLSDDDRLTIRNSVNVGLIFGPPDSTARYLFATGRCRWQVKLVV